MKSFWFLHLQNQDHQKLSSITATPIPEQCLYFYPREKPYIITLQGEMVHGKPSMIMGQSTLSSSLFLPQDYKMFFGLYSLWKIAEPSGAAYKRRFHLPMIAAVFYFLGSWMPLPFAPLGALLIGLGMILLGLASIRAKVWPGWRGYTPLLVGCFPFLFMFPLLLITGARPAAMIGLWSVPWIAMGIAAWQRSNVPEES